MRSLSSQSDILKTEEVPECLSELYGWDSERDVIFGVMLMTWGLRCQIAYINEWKAVFPNSIDPEGYLRQHVQALIDDLDNTVELINELAIAPCI